MKLVPNYPDTLWDGTSASRGSVFDDKAPDFQDWDRIVAEVMSMQRNIAGGADKTIVVKTFLLGVGTPITTGNNKLNKFTVPGGTTATLVRLRMNTENTISGTLSIRINIAGSSIGTFTISNGLSSALYNALSIVCNSGDVITVDVLSAAGQDLTVEMEFLTLAA
jgi:hypothetical protein